MKEQNLFERGLHMANRQTLISFDELMEVEITCGCGTGLVISSLSNAPKLQSLCAGCGRSLGNAQQAVLAFRQLYANASDFIKGPKEDSNPIPLITARTVRFRISENSN